MMNLIVCCALHTDYNVHVRHVFDPFHMTILIIIINHTQKHTLTSLIILAGLLCYTCRYFQQKMGRWLLSTKKKLNRSFRMKGNL